MFDVEYNCFFFFIGIEEFLKGEEEVQLLVEVQEIFDLLEGLDIQIIEKVVFEKFEILIIEIRGSDVVIFETEEVFFEIVIAEFVEIISLEFIVQIELVRFEKIEVFFKVVVLEVFEVVVKEIEELISKDFEEEKSVEEVIVVEELLRFEEELFVLYIVLQEEDVEEVVEDEVVFEIFKGEVFVFIITLEKLVV